MLSLSKCGTLMRSLTLANEGCALARILWSLGVLAVQLPSGYT